MFWIDPAKLQAMLDGLEQAQREHFAWQERLIGTLLCRLPHDPAELGDEAHCSCGFGRWYYGDTGDALRDQPAFAAIEAEHRRLHDSAAGLLLDVSGGRPVEPGSYERMVECSTRLRLEVDSLRHEIQAALRSSDALTGAYGRHDLLPELREWRELARRGVQCCCIAFMDLDRFKEINDRYGHPVGDRVLVGAVRCVAAQLRSYDKVFRYGGDEFLLSLPAADLQIGHEVTERIRRSLAGTPFAPEPQGEPVRITASFGLAALDPGVTVEESIDRADAALLAAKAAGRNRAISWSPEMARHPPTPAGSMAVDRR